ncbi:hypothetical protein BCEN4_1740017 [Burkholderia cenocepacia]|nr:hypothetical protein BCEN4_1740017 [Burkholderia cenocepacia]
MGARDDTNDDRAESRADNRRDGPRSAGIRRGGRGRVRGRRGGDAGAACVDGRDGRRTDARRLDGLGRLAAAVRAGRRARIRDVRRNVGRDDGDDDAARARAAALALPAAHRPAGGGAVDLARRRRGGGIFLGLDGARRARVSGRCRTDDGRRPSAGARPGDAVRVRRHRAGRGRVAILRVEGAPARVLPACGGARHASATGGGRHGMAVRRARRDPVRRMLREPDGRRAGGRHDGSARDGRRDGRDRSRTRRAGRRARRADRRLRGGGGRHGDDRPCRRAGVKQGWQAASAGRRAVRAAAAVAAVWPRRDTGTCRPAAGCANGSMQR